MIIISINIFHSSLHNYMILWVSIIKSGFLPSDMEWSIRATVLSFVLSWIHHKPYIYNRQHAFKRSSRSDTCDRQPMLKISHFFSN